MNEIIIKDESGKSLRLVTVDFGRCRSCYFHNKTTNNCKDIKCTPDNRSDCRDVMFVAMKAL